MAKMTKSIVALKRELKEKELEIQAAEEREAMRIGRLAIRAGLADLDIPEKDYQEVFEDLVVRFRGNETTPIRRKRAKGSEAAISPTGEPPSQGAEAP